MMDGISPNIEPMPPVAEFATQAYAQLYSTYVMIYDKAFVVMHPSFRAKYTSGYQKRAKNFYTWISNTLTDQTPYQKMETTKVHQMCECLLWACVAVVTTNVAVHSAVCYFLSALSFILSDSLCLLLGFIVCPALFHIYMIYYPTNTDEDKQGLFIGMAVAAGIFAGVPSNAAVGQVVPPICLLTCIGCVLVMLNTSFWHQRQSLITAAVVAPAATQIVLAPFIPGEFSMSGVLVLTSLTMMVLFAFIQYSIGVSDKEFRCLRTANVVFAGLHLAQLFHRSIEDSPNSKGIFMTTGSVMLE